MLKGFKEILTAQERGKGVKVFIASLFSGLLDFMGVAALLPLIIGILNGDGFSNTIFYWCLAVLVLVLLKHILLRYLTLYRSRYLLDIYKRLSREIFIGFYKKGLLFIREQGASNLVHRVNYNSYAFSFGVIYPLMVMSSDIILLLLISVCVTVYNPFIALILFICVLPFAILYIKIIKGKLRKYGKELEMSQRNQTKIVSETYRGFSELEMNGAYGLYERAFAKGIEDVSENKIKVEQFSLIPACLSELSIILALTLLLLFKAEDATLLIGLFSVAAFRLLPAVRNILVQWGKIQNSTFCIPIILEAINNSKNGEADGVMAADEGNCAMEVKFEREIEMRGVSYNYPSGERGVNRFSATIKKGEYVGLQGGSGIGKTTLFNILMRLIDSYSGEILIDGEPLQNNSKEGWQNLIGYVSQDVYLFSGTLAENIALGVENIDKERIMEIVRMVNLDTLVAKRGGGVDFTVSEEGRQLSGGERQRIGIARAIYKGAKLLLLDEATSALDDETEKKILDTINSLRGMDKDLTIIAIAHRESSLTPCDRVISVE